MLHLVTGSSEPRPAFISVDVEDDISLYLRDSHVGIEEGLPRLLDLLREERIPADFFIQGSLLPRFEDILAEIRRRGHGIGVHGLHHQRLFLRPRWVQRRDVALATRKVRSLLGSNPIMFRAPGFSASNATFDILEQLRYRIDSSVLPGATLRMMKNRIVVRDFANAPRDVYHPAKGDFLARGNRSILEVPLTENPQFPSSPLGLGFLQTHGLGRTLDAIQSVESPYCLFLIHTWEAVDLGSRQSGLPGYVRRECSDDLEPLRGVLGYLRDGWRLQNLNSLAIAQIAGPAPGTDREAS